jgi:hypothetical protein
MINHHGFINPKKFRIQGLIPESYNYSVSLPLKV